MVQRSDDAPHKRPTDKWTDADVTDAQRLMWRHRSTIKDLRKLLLGPIKLASNDGEHFLLQTIKSGEEEKYEDVTIGANMRQQLDQLTAGIKV